MSINNNWNKSFFYHSHSLWNNAPPEIKELNVKNALKITGQPIVVIHLCIIDINAWPQERVLYGLPAKNFPVNVAI